MTYKLEQFLRARIRGEILHSSSEWTLHVETASRPVHFCNFVFMFAASKDAEDASKVLGGKFAINGVHFRVDASAVPFTSKFEALREKWFGEIVSQNSLATACSVGRSISFEEACAKTIV